MTVTETTTGIETYFEADDYSPFKLCGIVNKILADLGLDKVLPAPMFYTYTAKGYIKTVNGETGKGRKVSKDEAIKWTQAYVLKQAQKA